ncbi:hypothetical protein [Roseibium aggregatum]|uniref:hypothetical protein n=1 Tax=Roseibium aggregatum TaxID=187304 RepID=UPI0025AB91F3|nr:hypothetical protein [Roseibium aggregatum]WJS05497.1 hypothetical protein QUB73_27140 [Roseibium aggregatum]
MVKGLGALKVSLTKNGYFKIAEVIKKHPRDEILKNINGVYDGINLDAAQIKNMLSFDEDSGEFPEVWDEIRTLGDKAIEALVFISIIYSHQKIINYLKDSNIAEMRGCLKRDAEDQKTYTNLVYSMHELDLCPLDKGSDEVYYDLSPLFLLEIGPFVKKIIRLKLEKTGWSEPKADDYFTRDFYQQCESFELHKALGISIAQFEQWLEGDKVEKEKPPIIEIPDTELETSAKLVAALATKPFVILAGTTGTGKTKTIRELAISTNPVSGQPDFNHAFIPVEAGWTDGRHLLGYKTPFGRNGENYVSTKLIDILLRANYPGHENIPFFVILDEMNLSHVEMYFSKFLAVLETAADKVPEPILAKEELELIYKSGTTDPVQTEYVLEAIKQKGLYLRKNIFFIGTVNMDETTYMFSPKVLDRAFVIQYSPPKPSSVGEAFSIIEEDKLTAKVNELAEYLAVTKGSDLSNQNDEFLDVLHNALGRFMFGPRTTNEVRRYFKSCEEIEAKFQTSASFREDDSVKDRAALQKILPKLNGSRDTLMPVLNNLKALCEKRNLTEAAAKVEAMKKEVTSNGFANYFSAI